MPLQNQGFVLAVSLIDIGGKAFTLRYKLTAADYAAADLARTAILASLGSVTNAAIGSHSLNEVSREDTVIFGTDEGENQAQITAKLVAPGKTANIYIPAPVDAMFVDTEGPDYDNVDPTNAALQTYLAHFEAGADATVSDGESIRDSATAGNFTGKRIHKASRKG